MWVFCHKKKEECTNLCLRHDLCLFQLVPQALFMFTPLHLAISQIDDVSNWKAWNILEQSMERGQRYFYFPWLSPKWKKRKEEEKKKVWSLRWKKNKEASFGLV